MTDHKAECKERIMQLFYGPNRNLNLDLMGVLDTVAAEWAKDKYAIESLLIQFAYDAKGPALTSGGLSALEDGFEALGWSNPHPIPWAKCEHPGCVERYTGGTPTRDGYKRFCGKHFREYNQGQ